MSSTKVTPSEASRPKKKSSLRRFSTIATNEFKKIRNSSGNGSEKKYVSLKDVLQVGQEYHGFRSMFIALFMAFLYANISGYHYEFPGDAFTQADVMEAWTAKRDGESVWDVKSMESSGQYLVDWLAQHIEASMAAGATDTILINNQYRVLAYHITLEFSDKTQMYHNRTSSEMCAWGLGGGSPCRSVYSYRRQMTEMDYMQYTTWQNDMTPIMKAALKPNPNSTNLKDALHTLRALAKYPEHWLTTMNRPWESEEDIFGADKDTTATSLILDGPPFYIPKRGQAIPTSLMVRMLYDADALPHKLYEDSSRRNIVLSGMHFGYPFMGAAGFWEANPAANFYAYRISETGLYDQTHEYMRRLPLEIICLCYLVQVLYQEMSSINAAREQYYKHIYSGRRKSSRGVSERCCSSDSGWYRIMCEGTGICCSSGWDCFDITTALFSIACILASWILSFVVPLFQTSHADAVKACIESSNCFSAGRSVSGGLLFALCLAGLLNIVGVFKYTKYHEGMRVYTMLFHESWKTLRDFIPWFLLLMVTQAWFISTLYSQGGTSKDMLYSGGALSVVLRLVFGFYDYDAFIAHNIGLGSFAAIGSVVFWVCVILGIVVAQNVMLAIVSQAYDNTRAQGNTLTTRMPLWTQLWNRLRFWIRRWTIKDPTKDMNESNKENKQEKFLAALERLPEWERQWYAGMPAVLFPCLLVFFSSLTLVCSCVFTCS